MTIVTKPLTDEKKDLKPLVIDEKSGLDGAVFVENGQDQASTITDVSVYQHPYKKHRTGFLLCLGLLLILTVACATMGSIYLYYRYSRPEGYRGSCTIRFNNKNQPGPSGAFGSSPFDQPPMDGAPFLSRFPPIPDDSRVQKLKPRNRMLFPETETADDSSSSGSSGDDLLDMQRLFHSFQQQFELDIQKQLWEILQVPRVPQLGLGRPARFIHDFSLNLTAILDMQSKECYIMPLNRSVIKPPQDMFEFLRGLEDGTYTLDGTAIRQNYYTSPLPVLDMSALGPFIARECHDSMTYMLVSHEPVNATRDDRVRRSVGAGDKEKVAYGEFAGSQLHRVNIVKMH